MNKKYLKNIKTWAADYQQDYNHRKLNEAVDPKASLDQALGLLLWYATHDKDSENKLDANRVLNDLVAAKMWNPQPEDKAELRKMNNGGVDEGDEEVVKESTLSNPGTAVKDPALNLYDLDQYLMNTDERFKEDFDNGLYDDAEDVGLVMLINGQPFEVRDFAYARDPMTNDFGNIVFIDGSNSSRDALRGYTEEMY